MRAVGAAGMDLRAAVPADAPLTLPPGGRALVPTGLQIAVPEGFEAQVRPPLRAGAEVRITCLNSPGTVDSDYRGEVGVILANLGAEPFVVHRGDRIAQLVVASHAQVDWSVVQGHVRHRSGATAGSAPPGRAEQGVRRGQP